MKTQETEAVPSDHFYQLTFDLSRVKLRKRISIFNNIKCFNAKLYIVTGRLGLAYRGRGSRFDTRVMFWIVRTKRCKTRRKWSQRPRPGLSCGADTSFPAKYECFGNAHFQRNDALRDGNFLIIDWSPVWKMNYCLKPSIM